VNRGVENDILQVNSIANQCSYIRYISESH